MSAGRRDGADVGGRGAGDDERVAVGAVAAAAGLALVELRAERRGLEDLFFQLTEASS